MNSIFRKGARHALPDRAKSALYALAVCVLLAVPGFAQDADGRTRQRPRRCPNCWKRPSKTILKSRPRGKERRRQEKSPRRSPRSRTRCFRFSRSTWAVRGLSPAIPTANSPTSVLGPRRTFPIRASCA